MTKKLIEKHEEISSQRASSSDQTKKTKYAHAGYSYVAPHSNYKESQE